MQSVVLKFVFILNLGMPLCPESVQIDAGGGLAIGTSMSSSLTKDFEGPLSFV